MTLKAKVSTDVVMYDHRITPAPKGVIVLCGNTELGTTVRSVFDESAHDCWYPMPKFPDSCKARYREKLRSEIGKNQNFQQSVMKWDPATGDPLPFPSHAVQYRDWHGAVAWLHNPWTGEARHPSDIGSDVQGLLIQDK